MKHGFATVLVLIMSLALSAAVLTFWHHVSNSVDISIEHERTARLTGYAECIIFYGTAMVQKHLDLMYRELHNQALSFEMDDVMVALGSHTGSARLILSKPSPIDNDHAYIMLNVTVEQGGYKCQIRCLFIKQKNIGQCSFDGYTFVTSL